MHSRLPLAIIFGAIGGCAGAAFTKGAPLIFALFGLTVGLAAFLIPENDRSVKLVRVKTSPGESASRLGSSTSLASYTA